MLEISSLNKSFARTSDGNSIHALTNINLNVAQNEVLAIVGTSGCGKSTLLRIISGLERPTSGQIKIDGTTIVKPHPSIAMVFQEPRLMPWLTAGENIRLALLDLPIKEQERRIQSTLKTVGLSDYMNALPKELSGGMAQRVAIARCLCRNPSILLLDEPFSALDSFTRQSLQDHIIAISNNLKLTMILVTHDIDEALFLADRVAIIKGAPGVLHSIISMSEPRPRKRNNKTIQILKEKINNTLNLKNSL